MPVDDDFRTQVVAVTRSWVGTPFCWQQSTKGVGCDCKGLIVGVAKELGRPEGDSFEAGIKGEYHHSIPHRTLREGLARLFDKSAEPRPGDILLLRTGGKPQHLAIYVGNNRMVHTYGKGPQKVIEVPMGRVWLNALDSVWSWKHG